MADKNSEALHWLSTLSKKQFAEFFYEVARERASTHAVEKLILACVDTSEGLEVEYIAGADEAAYGNWANDVPLCQSGTCQDCQSPLRSWAKNVICPICGAVAYCT